MSQNEPALTPLVAFVGAGPGDLGLITSRAATLLSRAQVVILDSTVSRDIVMHHGKEDAEIVTVESSGSGAVHLKDALAEDPEVVVRLVAGEGVSDPELAEELAAVRKAKADVELVPGVSPSTAVPAYAGLVPDEEWASHVVIDAGMAKTLEPVAKAAVAADSPIVVRGLLSEVLSAVDALVKAGQPNDSHILLAIRGTTVDQRTFRGILRGLRTKTKAFDSEAPTVAIITSEEPVRDETRWFDRRALFGWRVLVPCADPNVDRLTDRLAHFGAAWDLVATTSIEPPRTPAQMDRATQGLVRGSHGWVAFTSPHTVKAVRDRFEGLGLDARVLAGVKIASVGGETLQALQEWGIEPDLTPEGDEGVDVAALAEAWPAYDDIVDPVRGVLVLNAEVPTEELVESLTKSGWEVDEVVAYRTVRAAPPPEAVRDGIKRGRYDAVLFSSSSTVRNLVGIAGKPHPTTVIVCIGPNTARTAEEHGLRVAAIADDNDDLTLVNALADVAMEMHREAEAEGVELVRPSDRVRRRKR